MCRGLPLKHGEGAVTGGGKGSGSRTRRRQAEDTTRHRFPEAASDFRPHWATASVIALVD